MNTLCHVPFSFWYGLTKSPVVRTGLGPSVSVGMLPVGPVPLRCFHQATSSHPLTSGLRTAVVVHLDLLWAL